MPKKKGKRLAPVLLIGFLIFIAVFLYCISIMPYENVKFNNENVILLNDGWYYTDNLNERVNIDKLPAKLPASKGEAVVFSRLLPDVLQPGETLCFRSSQQFVRVFIDGREIYNFGNQVKSSNKAKSPGSLWNIVSLPNDSAGKTVSIELTSPYKLFSGEVNEVTIGTKSAHILFLIDKYLPSLVSAFFSGLVGIVLLVLYSVLLLKNEKQDALIYLGLFSLLISVWLFGESRMVQFFIGDQYLILAGTFLSLMLFPIPLIHYLGSYKKVISRRTDRISTAVLYCLALVVCIVQLTGAADFIEMLPYIQAIIILTGIMVMAEIIVKQIKEKNPSASDINVMIIFLLLMAGLESLNFYVDVPTKTGNFLQIWVLLFILYQAVSVVRKSLKIMNLSRVAGVDLLTGCMSRTAYIKKLHEINYSSGFLAVVMDLNNLKVINDTYGHEIGDDALVRCGKCIINVFGSYGDCFRTGGDEFAFIGSDMGEEKNNKLIEQFNEACRSEADKLSYPFCVAVGCASYDHKTDHTPSDTLRRADHAMYDCKHRQKDNDIR